MCLLLLAPLRYVITKSEVTRLLTSEFGDCSEVFCFGALQRHCFKENIFVDRFVIIVSYNRLLKNAPSLNC
jgi:hypothetical protein